MPEKKRDNFPEGRKPKASDPHHPHGGEHTDHSAGQHGHGKTPDSGHAAHSHGGEDAAHGGHVHAGRIKGKDGHKMGGDAHGDVSTPGGTMERLKASTQDLHNAAEGHPLQQDLFKGRLPRERYVENLGQMFLVHKALEGHIRHVRGSVPAMAKVVKDWQFQEPYLREDLTHFGVTPEGIIATPATGKIVASIDRAAKKNPIALLGFHYVLEGSNNGSKHVARAVRKAYGLTPGQGDRYLDPYGDAQHAKWQAFKTDMEEVGFSAPDVEALVGAAREMFAAISAIGDDLMAGQAAR